MLICPVCRSDALAPWGRRNGFDLYRCKQCTHRFAEIGARLVLNEDTDEFRTRFTHGLMKSDEEYYRHLWMGEREGQHTRETTRLILREVELLNIPPAQKWLDIGCGSGYLVAALARRGWEAVGIEPGGWGQIAAREKGIRVVQGFLEKDTFTGQFNCISATDVLEHQPEPRKLLDLIKQYLAPSGYAFFSVPYADSFHGRIIRHRWAMIEPPTHCQFFTRHSFETLLHGADFALARAVQFNRSYPPVLGRFRAARAITDWVLRATLGGDQVLFVTRPRSTAAQADRCGADGQDHSLG